MSKVSFYIKRNEKVSGPCDLDRLKQLYADAKLKPSDLIGQKQEGPWRKLAEIGPKLAPASAPSSKGRPDTGDANPKLQVCSDCSGTVSKRATLCPHCGAPLADKQDTDSGYELYEDSVTAAGRSSAATGSIRITPSGPGRLSCTGPYREIFAFLVQAIEASKVTVKNSNVASGEITGHSRYGVNLFGMGVHARAFAHGESTVVEITATFSDAFDTVGACKKKVQQIADNFMHIASSPNQPSTSGPSGLVTSRAPSPLSQAGISYKGKATTAFFLSLGGLFFVPLSFIAAVMGGMAHSSINASNNKEGSGLAMSAVLISFVSILLWLLIVINL